MRQYTNVNEMNEDITFFEKYFDKDGSVVGTKHEPYFDRDQQEWVDAWVITVDGWPQ